MAYGGAGYDHPSYDGPDPYDIERDREAKPQRSKSEAMDSLANALDGFEVGGVRIEVDKKTHQTSSTKKEQR